MSRVLVVFDCNVYLDVARLIGAPYSAEELHRIATEQAPAPVPHPTDAAMDSLRLIAACRSGRPAGGRALQVWSSTHIRNTVAYKAQQAVEPDPVTGHHGLGWDEDDAWDLVDGLVDWIVDLTNGDHLDTVIGAVDNPPLDHEDGTVFGACRHLEGQNPLDEVFCVTRDKGFIRAHRDARLSGTVTVLPPAAMLAWIRRRRGGVMPRPR